jgi:Asp-tRNA(Asn)/Glu-tRNA(Gln) amidotransferase A subunit family amidase
VASKTGWVITTAALLAGGWMLPAAAQQGIYSCVDAQGRHLTSDRPIAACIDREQKELNPSGTVKRTVPPSLTAEERARQEAKARQAQEQRAREVEEKRRDIALLTRYPNKAVHDKERNAALAVADDVMAAAHRRTVLLAAERQKLDAELEFYKSDPSKMPARLKRQLEENTQQIAEQKRFVTSMEGEKTRINARFDEELSRLRALWAPVTPASAASASAAAR